MWVLKITHQVENEIREFTRTSHTDHSWTYDGDGFWSFHNEKDEWSGVFRALVITEDKVDEESPAQTGEDPVSGWKHD